jgi:hypothetical protein
MLDAGANLRTWAVDAPIVPGVELPARLLPDHRRIYLSFEGPLSGDRGSVRRVAEGMFQTIEWHVDRVRVQLSGAQLVGEVDLYRSLSGKDSNDGSTTWTFLLGKVD